MKKNILTIIIVNILCITAANAQWLWASSATGTGAERANAIAKDASGNIFITGTFSSPVVTFGSVNLTRSGPSGTLDFFIAKYDPSGNVLWAASDSCTGYYEYGYGIATDASGNAFVTGSFTGTISFDSVALTSHGYADIFVVKYSPTGSVLWAKNFGGTNDDAGYGIATNSAGDILLAGNFKSSSITLDSITLTNAGIPGGQDAFAARIGTSGNVIWARTVGGTDGEFATGIATDASGNVVMAGYYGSSPLIIGSYTLTNAGLADVYVVKFDSSGNVLWAAHGGGNASEYLNGVATDAAGNVFITGTYYNTSITFGTTTLTNLGTTDSYLVKYSSSGSLMWARAISSIGGEATFSVATDAAGSALVTGFCVCYSVNFGTFTYYSTGLSNLIVFKYTSAGNAVWATSAVGTGGGDIVGYGIVTDVSGNTYITGLFTTASAGFGSTTLNNSGGSEVYVAALSAYTAIPDKESGVNFYLSPNPARSELVVQSSEFGEIESIEIYSSLGEKIFSQITSLKSQISIDVSQLPPGIYFVKAFNDKKVFIQKFIKQ